MDTINNRKFGKFLASNNTLTPRRPQLNTNKYYKLDYEKCIYSIVGKLINEYKHTACFEIVNWHEADGAILRNLGYRVIVRKCEAMEIE